ncbi:MAG: helix-turn-helix domain-containing protein [Bacteroidota bacterium]|nr:helix-turn-helix domain-containing protein [Bacteroidota bacterium]
MKIHIKYMVSTRCKMAVRDILRNMNLHFVQVELGEVDIMETLTPAQRDLIRAELRKTGLELMDEKKDILIEKIKNAVIEMVHYTEAQQVKNFSDHLAAKLNYDYTYLSNLFSETTGTTIERFIINHKIERVKELLVYDEHSLTEIAYRLHYSSVAHLSNQFKKVTGLTPTFFKQLKHKRLEGLENV